VLTSHRRQGIEDNVCFSPYTARAAVNIYPGSPHVVVCIMAPVLDSPKIVVLISPVYAGSCTWVSEKTSSRQLDE
jgi:hypothetical protein